MINKIKKKETQQDEITSYYNIYCCYKKKKIIACIITLHTLLLKLSLFHFPIFGWMSHTLRRLRVMVVKMKRSFYQQLRKQYNGAHDVVMTKLKTILLDTMLQFYD